MSFVPVKGTTMEGKNPRHVLYIIPVDAPKERQQWVQRHLASLATFGTKVSVRALEGGPEDLEYFVDHPHAVALLLEKLPEWLVEEQVKAISIGCFYDIGRRELREAVNIPVIGIGEASFAVARMLGSSWSVIVGREKWIPKLQENAYIYGVHRYICSWRPIGMSVWHLHQDPERAAKRIMEEAQAAVHEDTAEVIILGCAAMEGMAPQLQQKLNVPVIDPVIAGFKMAEMLADCWIRCKWTTSKLGDYAARRGKN